MVWLFYRLCMPKISIVSLHKPTLFPQSVGESVFGLMKESRQKFWFACLCIRFTFWWQKTTVQFFCEKNENVHLFFSSETCTFAVRVVDRGNITTSSTPGIFSGFKHNSSSHTHQFQLICDKGTTQLFGMSTRKVQQEEKCEQWSESCFWFPSEPSSVLRNNRSIPSNWAQVHFFVGLRKRRPVDSAARSHIPDNNWCQTAGRYWVTIDARISCCKQKKEHRWLDEIQNVSTLQVSFSPIRCKRNRHVLYLILFFVFLLQQLFQSGLHLRLKTEGSFFFFKTKKLEKQQKPFETNSNQCFSWWESP